MSKRPNISCLRQTLYYCELRNRLRGPFKAKKAKKILPAADTYYFELRERLPEAFQSQKGPKFPACGRHHIIVNREIGWRVMVDGALSKPKRQKNPACRRQLYWETGWQSPFKVKKAKKILPAAGTYIIVNWEIGWGGPLKAKKAKKILPAPGTYIIMNWERGWGRPFNAKMFKKILPAAGT